MEDKKADIPHNMSRFLRHWVFDQLIDKEVNFQIEDPHRLSESHLAVYIESVKVK